MTNRKTTDQRKTSSMLHRVHSHAKANCANHFGKDGCRVTAHGKCVLSLESERVIGNVCPYFMKAVLPTDSILFDQYLEFFPDDYPLKPAKKARIITHNCDGCSKQYVRSSNRQKYCEPCADDRKKSQARERMRRSRKYAE